MFRQCLRTTNEEKRQCERGNGVEYVDSLHVWLAVSIGALAEGKSATPCATRLGASAAAKVDPIEPTSTRGPEPLPRVRVPVLLPPPVAEWLKADAQRRFKTRSRHIADLLTELYRKQNPDVA